MPLNINVNALASSIWSSRMPATISTFLLAGGPQETVAYAKVDAKGTHGLPPPRAPQLATCRHDAIRNLLVRSCAECTAVGSGKSGHRS
ncbi:hypothetical protein UVI_02020870 [Ustilaginoidea virens]|uniref:Uncharacterized protein n=1 Tax=Ustilaginoidea virens TaxID=1159556 RepID=A0A1B5KZD4_USTVR|nr:hypothetical protein UVI_02020870 [Ustilaginoidea virens]